MYNKIFGVVDQRENERMGITSFNGLSEKLGPVLTNRPCLKFEAFFSKGRRGSKGFRGLKSVCSLSSFTRCVTVVAALTSANSTRLRAEFRYAN